MCYNLQYIITYYDNTALGTDYIMMMLYLMAGKHAKYSIVIMNHYLKVRAFEYPYQTII